MAPRRLATGETTTVLAWLAFALSALVMLVLGALIYQLLRQQGRLLLRLEALEQRLGGAAPHSTANGHTAHPVLPPGLPVGTPIESFELPALEGGRVRLDDLKGSPTLLVYWSPSCGFCDLAAPELASLQKSLADHKVQLVFLSFGDAVANAKMAQQHGLRARILLVDGHSLPAFAQMGTPVAYLLDEHGLVARPLAVGADQVVALAREAAGPPTRRLPGEKPLSQSLVLRDGLKPGTRAPGFSLPDIHGRMVSLDDYRGRRLLLVFSDPQCGPCNELAPQLAEVDRRHRDNNLGVLMVGRGDLTENRRKAEAWGLPFPVVVQEHWKLSKEYGIFATPVAFVINGDGIIEHPVAKGPGEILELVRHVEEAKR